MNLIRFCIIFFLVIFFQRFSFAQAPINFNGNFRVIGDRIEILTDSNSNIPLQTAIKSDHYKKSESKFPNLLTTPYSYWIRFTVKSEVAGKTLAIEITQPMVDNIDFYQLHNGVVVKSNFSGQRRLFNTRLVNHQFYIYPFNISPEESDTFYLHVKSGKQLVLPIYLGTLEQVFESALTKDISFGMYIGIIMVMLLYNLFVYTTVRDKNYLYYVLYLAIVLITQACMEGYIFRFILPNHPMLADISIYITTALIGLAAIEFAKHFLSARKYTPILYKISYVFWLLYSIQIILALTKHYNASYTIMLSSAMFSALYVLIMAITILVKGFRSAKFFLIAWSFFILCVVVYVLKDFNILFPYNEITSSALLIGSAFEAVLLSFALADKINIFKAEKEKSQEETLKALKENERIVREQNVILESKVEERTIELSESNHELNKTLEDLKQTQTQLVESEKMASLGQLTAGIAHEINNPINFVTSNINPLKRDIEMLFDALTAIENVGASDASPADKQKQIKDYKEELDFDYLTIEIKHLIKGINEGANRTAEIVKGLKIFSRLDEDDLKKADMNEGLESTMVIVNNLLNNKIKVVKQYDDLPDIECYPGKLNQVFLNIISNAIYAVQKKFGENAGGEIAIVTSHNEENVFIKIKDNGTGMDAQTQKKVFEPFFTTKDVGEGTGLGMSIAYNTIKKHNGQITINSTPNEGTEFILQIPVVFNLNISTL
ncbi:MAG TPA: 7TM diverse intracellular signaling domain-containing protein [Mucilaginibacter sp.]